MIAYKAIQPSKPNAVQVSGLVNSHTLNITHLSLPLEKETNSRNYFQLVLIHNTHIHTEYLIQFCRGTQTRTPTKKNKLKFPKKILEKSLSGVAITRFMVLKHGPH